MCRIKRYMINFILNYFTCAKKKILIIFYFLFELILNKNQFLLESFFFEVIEIVYWIVVSLGNSDMYGNNRLKERYKCAHRILFIYMLYNQIETSNRSNSQISKFQLKETNHVAAKLPCGTSMFIKVNYCTSEKSICWIHYIYSIQ